MGLFEGITKMINIDYIWLSVSTTGELIFIQFG